MLVLVLAVLATLMIVLRIVSRELSFDLDAEPSPVYGLVGALLPVVLWAKDQRFGPGFFLLRRTLARGGRPRSECQPHDVLHLQRA